MTAEAPTQTAATTRQFHFVITLQWNNSRGTASSSYAGTYGALPGQTRAEVFAAIKKSAQESMNVEGSGVVLFFSLEPDDLAGG